MGSVDPLRITVDAEERHAVALESARKRTIGYGIRRSGQAKTSSSSRSLASSTSIRLRRCRRSFVA